MVLCGPKPLSVLLRLNLLFLLNVTQFLVSAGRNPDLLYLDTQAQFLVYALGWLNNDFASALQDPLPRRWCCKD